MSATDQPLDALMPEGSKAVVESHYWSEWGVFWVVILTVIIFFIAIQCWSWRCAQDKCDKGDKCGKDKCDSDRCDIRKGKNKKPCIDKTPYAGIAFLSLLIAILLVWAVSYLFHGENKSSASRTGYVF